MCWCTKSLSSFEQNNKFLGRRSYFDEYQVHHIAKLIYSQTGSKDFAEKNNVCFGAYLWDQSSNFNFILFESCTDIKQPGNSLYHYSAGMRIFTTVLLIDSVNLNRMAASQRVHHAQDGDLCFDHASVPHQIAFVRRTKVGMRNESRPTPVIFRGAEPAVSCMRERERESAFPMSRTRIQKLVGCFRARNGYHL